MLETLTIFDRQLFHFINVTCANPVTDVIMPQITSDLNLRIAFGLIIVLLFWKGTRERRWLVVGSIVALAISDLTSSSLVKPLVERPRPCHNLTDINLLVNCGAGFSMPSSHAANAFAQWMFWSATVPKLRWHLFVVACLVAISRLFVGVHYPGDILIGGLIGILVGGIVYAVERQLLSRASR